MTSRPAPSESLFRPFDLGALHLENRVVMAPMTRSHSPGGLPTAEVASYYRRRAEGGVGLIVTEGTVIERSGSCDDPAAPRFWGEDALAAWGEVRKAVHGAGGRIMPQIWHVGATQGRRSQWAPDAGVESPSGLMAPGQPFGRAMDEDDIAATIKAYGEAAARAQDLGFDGVEIHGAHGYLIDQFLWAPTNLREDRYGGATAADRTRFAAEVVAEARRRTGPGFPLILRISQFKQQDYTARLAHTPEELAELLAPLTAAGVDAYHCSERRFWEPAFEGSHLNLAGWAKTVSGKPSITVGSVGLKGEFIGALGGASSGPASLDQLLVRLQAEEFDLVAVGRALLSDPLWLRKIRDGRQEALIPFDPAHLQTLS